MTAHRRVRNGCLGVGCLLFAVVARPAPAEDLYRVEVLVFRHTYSDMEPADVEALRGFHELFDLHEQAVPPAPRPADGPGAAFEDLWRRLQRLDSYEPLVVTAWEQTQFDYHPPVRVHDGKVIAEELQLPGEVVYIDLRRTDPLEPFVGPLYRLDGSAQLRRSRFLHLEFDLEYRVDNPRWSEVYRAPDQSLESGGRVYPVTEVLEEAPEPYRVYRLRQSRQAKTGELHYFDTGYLGVLARVTEIGSAPE